MASAFVQHEEGEFIGSTLLKVWFNKIEMRSKELHPRFAMGSIGTLCQLAYIFVPVQVRVQPRVMQLIARLTYQQVENGK